MTHTTKNVARVSLVALALGLAACPAGTLPGTKGGGLSNPNKCGDISSSDIGRKLQAFLTATAELDEQVTSLEGRVHAICIDMGKELGLPAEQLRGDTAQICDAVSKGIQANLQVGLKAEAKLKIDYKPAVCTVSVDAAATVAAECSGKATADVGVACEGTCGGTCKCACDGNCQAQNAAGECEGTCEGTCRGSCQGSCQGTADVDVEAECKAAAEVRANAKMECTPAELTVAWDADVVVDAAKLDAAKAALEKGLPELLTIAARMKGVAKALVVWGGTAKDLAASSGKLAGELGKAAMCVSAQLTAAVSAMASFQVKVDVSVQASASIGGSAGMN